MCTPTHTDDLSVFIQCRWSLRVHLSCLYYVYPAWHSLILCAVQCVYVFIFVLQTLSQRWVVNALWTVYKRDRVRLEKDGCNMCSVMCAVIDMLTSSFQAAALKPRLDALIGFSRVCGCIRQCNMRHSVFYGLFKKMPKFLFFFAPFAQHISVGFSEGTSL